MTVYGGKPRTMLVLNGSFREDFQLVNQNPAPKRFTSDEITYLRPVSSCSGCRDTKVSWSLMEGMRRFNRKLGLKGKDRYELIYTADRGCGNLQGYHAYRIVDAIFCMGSGAIVGDGIKESCSEKQIVVTASGDGAYNFNISGIKFAAKKTRDSAQSMLFIIINQDDRWPDSS